MFVALYSYYFSELKNVLFYVLGVFFDARVEHIKFVDFCGKYRIPLLQYLCSPRCSSVPDSATSQSESTSSDDDGDIPESRIRRVLLG